MEFEQYLDERKIDSKTFQAKQPEQWEDLKKLFEQVHPNSFTAQKKFIINVIRREFPLLKQE